MNTDEMNKKQIAKLLCQLWIYWLSILKVGKKFEEIIQQRRHTQAIQNEKLVNIIRELVNLLTVN